MSLSIDNENYLDYSNSYSNNFVWINFIENIIPKIEKQFNSDIDYTNYKKYFSNINNLDISQIIVNTKEYPYLDNVIESAKNNPNKNYNIIYDEMIDLYKFDLLKKFNLFKNNNPESYDNKLFISEDEINWNAYLDLKYNFHQSIHNYFNEKEIELQKMHGIKNIHFIDIANLSMDIINLFHYFNIDDIEIDSKLLDFENKILNYLNFDINSRANKIDIDKIFSLLLFNEENRNILLCDFDQKENFDLNIIENHNNCIDCPKFSLMGFTQHPKNSFSTGCHAALLYSPEVTKKLFLVLLDHTLSNPDAKLGVSESIVCIEKKFEILFEFLHDKDFNSNNELRDFLINTKYNDLYNDYDSYFKKYINYSRSEIMSNFFYRHFIDDYSRHFHITKNNIEYPSTKMEDDNLYNFIFSNDYIFNKVTASDNEENGKTWLRNL